MTGIDGEGEVGATILVLPFPDATDLDAPSARRPGEEAVSEDASPTGAPIKTPIPAVAATAKAPQKVTRTVATTTPAPPS